MILFQIPILFEKKRRSFAETTPRHRCRRGRPRHGLLRLRQRLLRRVRVDLTNTSNVVIRNQLVLNGFFQINMAGGDIAPIRDAATATNPFANFQR